VRSGMPSQSTEPTFSLGVFRRTFFMRLKHPREGCPQWVEKETLSLEVPTHFF
jgi:hypothetical protein